MAEERNHSDSGRTLGMHEYGPHYYGRRDLHISEELKQGAVAAPNTSTTKSSYRILRKENMDGVKFFLDAPTNGNGAELGLVSRVGTENYCARLRRGRDAGTGGRNSCTRRNAS